MRGHERMWTLRGTWPAQATPSPSPLWPKREQDVPEKGNINNALVATLHKVRVGGISCLRLSTSSKDAAASMVLALVRIATP